MFIPEPFFRMSIQGYELYWMSWHDPEKGSGSPQERWMQISIRAMSILWKIVHRSVSTGELYCYWYFRGTKENISDWLMSLKIIISSLQFIQGTILWSSVHCFIPSHFQSFRTITRHANRSPWSVRMNAKNTLHWRTYTNTYKTVKRCKKESFVHIKSSTANTR